METYTIEIKAAEGGDDSKIFAKQLTTAYTKLCDKQKWSYT